MKDILLSLFMAGFTIAAYLVSIRLYRKHRRIYTTPVIVSTVVIIAVLLLFHLSYDTYMIGGQWINHLLGPAVVALAYPLYQYRDILKQMLLPIVTGTTVGAVVGIGSGLLLSKWAGFSSLIIHSIVPKSVTTPVAMSISESTGGVMPLTAVFRDDRWNWRHVDSPVCDAIQQAHSPNRPRRRDGECVPRDRNSDCDGAGYARRINQYGGDDPECRHCLDYCAGSDAAAALKLLSMK